MNKWILGARPRTLSAAIAPVLIASALAGSEFNWFRAALALKVAVWLQIGVNYANDYSDGVKGTDENRVGPTRLVASGLASAKAVKNAAFISFAIASIAFAEITRYWILNTDSVTGGTQGTLAIPNPLGFGGYTDQPDRILYWISDRLYPVFGDEASRDMSMIFIVWPFLFLFIWY